MGTFEDLAEVVEQLRARSPLRVERSSIPNSRSRAVRRWPPRWRRPRRPRRDGDGPRGGSGRRRDGDGAHGRARGIARRRSRSWRTRWPTTANRFRSRANSTTSTTTTRPRPTAQRLSGRSLLISNAVVAFAVIGFASLAVAVAITRPADRGRRSPWWDTRTPPRESSCRCCRLSSRLRYRRLRPISRTPDTRAASFRTPTATFRRSWCSGGGPVRRFPASPGTPGFVPNPNRCRSRSRSSFRSRAGGRRIRPP